MKHYGFLKASIINATFRQTATVFWLAIISTPERLLRAPVSHSPNVRTQILEAVKETGNVLRTELTKTGAYFYFKRYVVVAALAEPQAQRF